MQTNITKIYFDTNTLEVRVDKNNLILTDFKFSNAYYDLINFIETYKLQKQVKIILPSIVLKEIEQQMIECYQLNSKTLRSQIDLWKKVFGDIIDIDFRLTVPNTQAYIEYVVKLENNLVKENSEKFLVAEYPPCLDRLVSKALRSDKPFSKAKGNGKEYTDAGFKDSLILETINSTCNFTDENVILFSNDFDFHNIITDKNFNVFCKIDEVKEYLNDYYGIDEVMAIRKKFVTSTYLQETILNSADCKLDDSVNAIKILSVHKISDTEFVVTEECYINEVKYMFTVDYDDEANEITGIKYNLDDD